MKKLILLFGTVAILLTACSDMFGGSDGGNGSDGVRDKIESAKDGDTISLRDYDDEKSTYTVTARNLTLENANMPNTTIVVSEKIGEDSFTLKNCVFKALEVNGGGSNSVHIEGGEITKVIAKKKDVRIVLEKGAKVTDLNIELNCTLDADNDTGNKVEKISISKAVTEFKIGAEKETSSESIKITITNIKLETAGAGEGNVKIVVKNPEIVKGTAFSSDMSDKVFDSDGNKVDIKIDNAGDNDDNGDDDGTGDGTGDGDDTGDTDDTVDEEGYKKLPLQLQEKFIGYSADSDGWSDGVTIEPKENGDVFLIKNTNPVNENVYKFGTRINMPHQGEKGKSYSVKFDLKAAENCYVCVRVEDRLFNFEHPTIWCNLSNEWQSFEIHTGILYEDWSEYTTLTISMGYASEVEIKNLRIKEDGNLCLPTFTYYTRKDLVDGIKVTSSENSVVFTSSKHKRDPNDTGRMAGVDIMFGNSMDTGNLYKVTFDVTPDDSGSFMDIWGHGTEDEYDIVGNSHFSFEKGVKKTITLYIPSYAISYAVVDANGNKIGDDGKRKKNIGYIWFSCVDDKEHTITVENIKSEVVENIETIKDQNKLGFYVAGHVTDNENYEWTGYKDLDNHNADDDIILMPDYGIYFDCIMSNDKGWDNSETAITVFRYGADESIVNKVSHEGFNKLYYENKETCPVALHFGLDDEWRVTIDAKDATERLRQVEQESAWYYFEFDPSKPEWSNFKNDDDRWRFGFSIQYNDGINNSYGFGFPPDIQDAIYMDNWTYDKYEEGEYWCPYRVSYSERLDKPKYESTDGKLRIYFYSETSKLGSTLIPSLKVKTPYVHVWDGIAENTIGNGWPMTKVE